MLRAPVAQFFCSDVYPSDYPDADILIMLNRSGFSVREVPVQMRPSEGQSMHGGHRSLYYVYKMLLSIFVTVLPILAYRGLGMSVAQLATAMSVAAVAGLLRRHLPADDPLAGACTYTISGRSTGRQGSRRRGRCARRATAGGAPGSEFRSPRAALWTRSSWLSG